ncbi:hypothetical protein Tco_1000845, partial [Tanacetum coccineum]
NRGQGNNTRGGGIAGYGGAQNRVRNANLGQARQIKCYNCNGICHIARNCTQPKHPQNSEYFKDKMLLMQAQENGVELDEEQLLFIAADDCDAFDSDVDEAPTTQTMFMANLSSTDPVYDKAGLSYDPDILSEYVKDNAVPVVESNVSSVPNDAYMMILNEMHESPVQYVSGITQNTVVDKSLTAELETYKEQVELYARRANIVKMKAEALKEQNTRPIKALTVYPPNTPATLVLECLPTKGSEINIFTLRQLFSEFEKTCKKRITPTGITEGERGFEQTKTCYLTEDKHDEIERKNLLIEHDNIIADGLSKEVFYVASNSELNVSRFTEMQKAHNVVKARCLELEAELSNLRDNIHKDNYNELLNRFSNLEVNHLNLQLKYQNLKDSFQNKPSSSVNDTPDFNSVFL